LSTLNLRHPRVPRRSRQDLGAGRLRRTTGRRQQPTVRRLRRRHCGVSRPWWRHHAGWGAPASGGVARAGLV